MFFSQILLNKKGPLSTIWLAAHWGQKLKRVHIFQIDIESSVRNIMSQEVIFDLRTTGHLLLGISKVYSRKTQYLLSECNDIFIRIKMAFRPGINLPDNRKEAAMSTITLQEHFYSFDEHANMMDVICASNQSLPGAITIIENLENNIQVMEDDLDVTVDELEILRGIVNIDEDFCPDGFLGNPENNLKSIADDDNNVRENRKIPKPQPIDNSELEQLEFISMSNGHVHEDLNDHPLDEPMEINQAEQEPCLMKENEELKTNDELNLEVYQALSA